MIVGSALVDIIADSEETTEGVDRLEAKAAELKRGARRGAGEAVDAEDVPEPEQP